MTDQWCILRMAGPRTLAVAQSLTEAGFEVWTPVEERQRLAGRDRKLVEQTIPIIPGWAFARAHHLPELLAISRCPTAVKFWDKEQFRTVAKSVPHFSVFRMNGEFRPQSDEALGPLRQLEDSLKKAAIRRREAGTPKGKVPKFNEGDLVAVEDGSGFEGLTLTVAERNEGRTVKVIHSNWHWAIEISAWKLKVVRVREASPHRAFAEVEMA